MIPIIPSTPWMIWAASMAAPPLRIVDDVKGNGSCLGEVKRHARLLLDDAQGLLAHKALGRGEALDPVAQKVGPIGAVAHLLNVKVDVVGEGDDEVCPSFWHMAAEATSSICSATSMRA